MLFPDLISSPSQVGNQGLALLLDKIIPISMTLTFNLLTLQYSCVVNCICLFAKHALFKVHF